MAPEEVDEAEPAEEETGVRIPGLIVPGDVPSHSIGQAERW
jgi:hypothetical protein